MLQVMNEPVHVSPYEDMAADMIENFYPGAYNHIQDMENSLDIEDADRVHIQFMVRYEPPQFPHSHLGFSMTVKLTTNAGHVMGLR